MPRPLCAARLPGWASDREAVQCGHPDNPTRLGSASGSHARWTFDEERLLSKVRASCHGYAWCFRRWWGPIDRQNVKSGLLSHLEALVAGLGNAQTSHFPGVAKTHSFAVTGP